MALVIHMHWTLLQIQLLFYHAVPCQSMSRADCEYVYIYAHMGLEVFATVNDEETPGSFWAT